MIFAQLRNVEKTSDINQTFYKLPTPVKKKTNNKTLTC